ncbi:hypothetical protein ACFX13_021586 [Malus domestica]
MESHSSRILVVTILVSLTSSLAPVSLVLASTACKFPAIFNFGDSNSDTSGFSAVFGQAGPPHGQSYFHHRPVVIAMASLSLIDFIAKSLIFPFLSAYLDSMGSNFTHGTNFATLSPTVRPPNTTLRQIGISPISLDVQYDQFYDFPSRSQIVRSRGPCSFPAIFNFGDSNSDTGGLSAAFGQAPYPNGETYFHVPSGRFSDGRLVIDFIAESLGLPHLSAFLDSMGSNFSHGANFATAGSTVIPPNTTISQGGASPISLDVQLLQFSDFRTRSQIYRTKGELFEKSLPKEEYFSQALYTLDIGQNDITAGYKLNWTAEQVKAYLPYVLTQLSNAIKSVYDQGGRSFWIHNTGPLGCLPYVLVRFVTDPAQINKYGCAYQIDEVAKFFNQRLKEAVVQLKKDLPLAAITYVDVYSVKYTLITQAKKYGFENPLIACCGHGGKYNFDRYAKCGAKKMINGTETLIAKSCDDPTVRINWDGTHFTEAANKWIFQQIVNGSFSDPPNPLKTACRCG